jgi:hypothetical protein
LIISGVKAAGGHPAAGVGGEGGFPAAPPAVTAGPVGRPPWTCTAMPYRLGIDTSGNRLPAILTVIMSLAANLGVNPRTAADGRDFRRRPIGAMGVVSMPKKHEERERAESFGYRPTPRIADFTRRGVATSGPGMSRHLRRRGEFRPALSSCRMDPEAVQANPANERSAAPSRRGFPAGTSPPPLIGLPMTRRLN